MKYVVHDNIDNTNLNEFFHDHTFPRGEYGHTFPRESMAILILLICESIGLLSQLFLGKNQLNNDVRKENGIS